MILTPWAGFAGSRLQWGVTQGAVRTAGALELEAVPEDGTESLRSHAPDGTERMRRCLRVSRKWLLEMESTPGGDAVTTVK